jgi:hypothetical protein
MAFSGPYHPNMTVVRFIMDNLWMVARLEAYLTTYQPGGIALSTLRCALGHARVSPPVYARCLSRLASILFEIGHVKTVPEVIIELHPPSLLIPPGQLTVDQVGP